MVGQFAVAKRRAGTEHLISLSHTTRGYELSLRCPSGVSVSLAGEFKLPENQAAAPRPGYAGQAGVPKLGNRYLIDHSQDVACIDDAERIVPRDANPSCFGY